jgi:alanine dehydrogenase
VILGAGEVAREAALVAGRLGCRIQVFSRGALRLATLSHALAAAGTPVATHTLADDAAGFATALAAADLVIAGVLEPGTLSPKLVTRAMLRTMRPGSALVDVGIDQGGIAETSRMTSLGAPTYVEEGVVHSCVPNLPALVARTATLALEAAALPHVRALATRGLVAALTADPGLAAGVMTWDGEVVHPGLAADCGRAAVPGAWQR